jgi:hypothetical protein
VLDTLNFCFWPAGRLEYDALAGGLKRCLEADIHALDADRLLRADEHDIARWVSPELPELPERARLVRECGAALLAGHDGRASAMARAACGSAAALVAIVAAAIPGFRDSAVYAGRQVFFYKRAQIFVGDVWGAFEGAGLGRFDDIGALTMFPDYRVPQLLHGEGVLVYSAELEDTVVRSQREIGAGAEQECEIRAASVQAVEELSKHLSLPPIQVDWLLWGIGETRQASLPPHHKTRTIFY